MRLFHKRFLPIAMAVAVVTAVPPSLFARCGVERWSVKTGTDSDATQVRLTVAPTPTTISDLISLTPPHPIPKAHRVSPTETTVWTVDAILTDYKIEDSPTTGDSDYHLVLRDEDGNTMVAEIPSPDCVDPSSPFASKIRSARQKFDSKLTAAGDFQTANLPVRVVGVGLFDFFHHQRGAAPNVVELHPVLDITFQPTTTSPSEPVPPAGGTGPSGPRWEYRLITSSTTEALLSQANSLGSQGWEMVGVAVDPSRPDRFVGYLKRLKQP